MKDDLSEKVTRPWVPFREFIGNNPYLGFFRTNNLTVIVGLYAAQQLPSRERAVLHRPLPGSGRGAL